MFAQYNVALDPQEFVDRWMSVSVKDGAGWPDTIARKLGQFSVKKLDKIYEISIFARGSSEFRAVSAQVWRSAGIRHVVVVADIEGHGMHTMAA
eukprot:14359466-Alexandrium_andersonii.AAC.1